MIRRVVIYGYDVPAEVSYVDVFALFAEIIERISKK